jgi:hypothetical protein
MSYTRHILKSVFCYLGFSVSVQAAVFYTETFSGSLNGWTDRDPGEMSVAYQSGFGDPAGSARGQFGNQLFPVPQTDAFRIDSGSSGGAFTGNYWDSYAGFTGFKFNFYATNVLPSTLSIRFGDGTNVFTGALSWQVLSTGSWYTVRVPLDYYNGHVAWFGGTAAQFSNALSAVSFIDIEITRNGTGTQRYFVDNFSLVDELLFVPEPTSGLFWFGWALVFGGLRRKLAGGRAVRSPYALDQTKTAAASTSA